jgi:hypothetical protein
MPDSQRECSRELIAVLLSSLQDCLYFCLEAIRRQDARLTGLYAVTCIPEDSSIPDADDGNISALQRPSPLSACRCFCSEENAGEAMGSEAAGPEIHTDGQWQ